MAEAWYLRLPSLESELGRDLPDAPEVVSEVAKVIRKRCAGLCERGAPLGRFLFVGPIELARRLATGLARALFGDERRVLQLDMGAYADKHNVTRLIGHDGGLACAYVEGDLTEPLLRQPQRVVLMEEVEKANSDVRLLLMGAFADGQLVDWIGRTVSLEDTVFVLTTMVGYEDQGLQPDVVVEADGRRAETRTLEETRAAIERAFPAEILRGTFIDGILVIRWNDHVSARERQ
jgi:ATP-dependent Clp protease ATP-binding subunit ClpC